MTADIAHDCATPRSPARHLEALQMASTVTTENLDPSGANRLLTAWWRTCARWPWPIRAVNAGRRPVDLPALVAQVLDRFRPQAEARQVDWAWRLRMQLYSSRGRPVPHRPVISNLLAMPCVHPSQAASSWRSSRRGGCS